MPREVDLLKVDLSARGWLLLLLAFVFAIVAFVVANWGVGQLKGLIGGLGQKTADWTA